jgi:hypothetical protein
MATEQEQAARGRLVDAQRRIRAVDEQRTESLEAAARLGEAGINPALQSMLVSSGARHLLALGDQRAELADEAEVRRQELTDAARRARSMDRLIDRIDETERDRRRRQAEAEMLDATVTRAVADRSGP